MSSCSRWAPRCCRVLLAATPAQPGSRERGRRPAAPPPPGRGATWPGGPPRRNSSCTRTPSTARAPRRSSSRRRVSRARLARFGGATVARFDALRERFGDPDLRPLTAAFGSPRAGGVDGEAAADDRRRTPDGPRALSAVGVDRRCPGRPARRPGPERRRRGGPRRPPSTRSPRERAPRCGGPRSRRAGLRSRPHSGRAPRAGRRACDASWPATIPVHGAAKRQPRVSDRTRTDTGMTRPDAGDVSSVIGRVFPDHP